MLLTVNIEAKSIGNKDLFSGLQFVVEAGQKIGIVGRNGVGKTTLFRMLSGEDTDFAGDIQKQRNLRMISTAQEHHAVSHQPVIEYVLSNLPEYAELKHILDSYPETMGDDMRKITTYSRALERFSDLGYYTVEDEVLRTLERYQISASMAAAPMDRLSGGQKRFVELVRIEHADADLALIDEPTNHMDFAAKAVFVEWLKGTRQAALVITHDRDVLQTVDKIIEIKDGGAQQFKGNYEAYLAQNAVTTAAGINDYQTGLKTLDNLQRKILWARARKPSWHGTADQRNPFKVMEERLQKEHDALKANLAKPSFWIDRETASNLPKKIGDNYHKFKAKNIQLNTHHTEGGSGNLLTIDNVQLGYDDRALFQPLSVQLQPGDRLRIAGRNGAGKTTLVRAIVATSQSTKPSTLIQGKITCSQRVRLSVYEQEVKHDALQLSLEEAIENIYRSHDLPADVTSIKKVMGNYLFDPMQDGLLRVEQLSGGQKARLQIIAMLAAKPNLLILDEPTNHLDLPSIEELETALERYNGAIIYVSHDSYFTENVGGDTMNLQPIQA